jgi:hypothetical protein
MRQQILALFLLAAGLTLLNAVKPLHMDDAAYAAYAAHISQQPLTPYAFEIYCGDKYLWANQQLAPPVVLYWLAGVIRLLGHDPLWWKLSLLPFHVLLVVSLYALFRRFAGGWTLTLVTLTVLSPALLPATNLMLDVPALALGLAAIAMFVRGSQRSSLQDMLAAGVLAGLAMQAKYTAFVTPAVFLAYGLTQRCCRPALAAAAIALLLFVGWEIFVAWQHGDSHFLLALKVRQDAPLQRAFRLALPLLTMTAGVAPGTLLLALYATTRSWRLLAVAAGLLLAGILLVGLVPETVAVFARSAAGQPRFGLEILFYGSVTLLFWLGLASVVWQLVTQGRRNLPPGSLATHAMKNWHRVTLFLLLWLGLEIAGYFALSPFAAARRVLGIVVVATILSGRLTALEPNRKRSQEPLLQRPEGCVPQRFLPLFPDRPRGPVVFATLVGAVWGALVAAIDCREALAARDAAQQAKDFVSGQQHGGTAWFNSAWGFDFYATHGGFVPLVPDHQTLRAGDLVVLVELPLDRPDFGPDQAPLLKLAEFSQVDALPWRTVRCYYGGRTPLRHHAGPRVRLAIYRVLADFVPTSRGTLPALH